MLHGNDQREEGKIIQTLKNTQGKGGRRLYATCLDWERTEKEKCPHAVSEIRRTASRECWAAGRGGGRMKNSTCSVGPHGLREREELAWEKQRNHGKERPTSALAYYAKPSHRHEPIKGDSKTAAGGTNRQGKFSTAQKGHL